jgi:hypothetical protein
LENVVEIPLVTEEMPHDADGERERLSGWIVPYLLRKAPLVASRSANKIRGSIAPTGGRMFSLSIVFWPREPKKSQRSRHVLQAIEKWRTRNDSNV